MRHLQCSCPARPGLPDRQVSARCSGSPDGPILTWIMIEALIFFVLPPASGVLAGFFGRWWGTLLAAAGWFGLAVLVVEDLEVPGRYIGLWLGGFAAVGGLIGVLVHSRRGKRAH